MLLYRLFVYGSSLELDTLLNVLLILGHPTMAIWDLHLGILFSASESTCRGAVLYLNSVIAL